jgi:arginase family enzyme
MGGLNYRQLRAILADVALRGRIVGFDVVELNPAATRQGRRRGSPHGSSPTS